MRILSIILVMVFIIPLQAEKIKELANVIGVRDNQLIGYGIVVGLRGTGDGSSSKFTLQSLSNLLQTVNVKINPNDIKSKNIAAVFVTAKLPPFSRQGDKLDVVISSIGDAKSLEGGTLLMTPLKGVDGDIYALAQGSVTIGGMNAGKGQLNHATAGSVASGALVEREVAYDIYTKQGATLSLNESDFQTALSIQNRINKAFDDEVAIAVDPRTVRMKRPADISMVEFIARTLDLEVMYEREEKIVIDERTGTVVAGINIKVDPIVITHGEITLKVEPQPISEEAEVKDDKEKEKVAEPKGMRLDDNIFINSTANTVDIKDGEITVANVTRALNKLGASPKDIISILENIKRAGAIRAKLEII